jgi:hypothetical protein
MPEEHLFLKKIIAYVMRNERPMDESDIAYIEKHIAACGLCREELKKVESRYNALGPLKDAKAHYESLNRQWAQRQRNKKRLIFTASGLIAAVFLLVTVSVLCNYLFYHGDKGLSEFKKDYEYAMAEEHYRGSELPAERMDIKDFKRGVVLLFNARQSVLSFPAGYDMDKVLEAEQLFIKTDSMTADQTLKNRIKIFREKIGKIRE